MIFGRKVSESLKRRIVMAWTKAAKKTGAQLELQSNDRDLSCAIALFFKAKCIYCFLEFKWIEILSALVRSHFVNGKRVPSGDCNVEPFISHPWFKHSPGP